jgi:ribosomal protein S18 acetylase RimI-like enzyme
MMQKAEAELLRLGCPKINIQVRMSNHDVIAFYRSIGFEQEDVLSLGKRLISDEGEET